MNTNDTPAKDLLFPETADITPTEALEAFSHKPDHVPQPPTVGRIVEFNATPSLPVERSEFQRILDRMDEDTRQAVNVQTFADREYTMPPATDPLALAQEAATDALTNYTTAIVNRLAFEAAAAHVLTPYKDMNKEIADLETKLKEAVRAYGFGVENDSFNVTATPYTETTRDVQLLLARAPWLAQVPGVVLSVDWAKVGELNRSKSKFIPDEIITATTDSHAGTTRVSIEDKTKPKK